MAIQNDTTGPVQNRYSALSASPPSASVGYALGGGGFGAAVLVAMVFIVVGILFATIPTNTFFSNNGGLTPVLPASEGLQLADPATGAPITVPGN